jgi:hypothetical protein
VFVEVATKSRYIQSLHPQSRALRYSGSTNKNILILRVYFIDKTNIKRGWENLAGLILKETKELVS